MGAVVCAISAPDDTCVPSTGDGNPGAVWIPLAADWGHSGSRVHACLAQAQGHYQTAPED